MDRRTFVATIGSVGTVALAGCLSDELTLTIKNPQDSPIENAEISVIEEGGLFQGDETITTGYTDPSGIFSYDIDSGEYVISVSHEDYGHFEEEIEIDADTSKELSFRYNIKLIVSDSDENRIRNADIDIVEDRLSGDDIISGRTNENGEFFRSFESIADNYEISINHDDYLAKTETIVDPEFISRDSQISTSDVTLQEDNAENRARIEVENILESETDFDAVREINIEDNGNLEVEAKTDWFPFSATESRFASKAADIIEEIFSSSNHIDYFEVEIHGETVDEYGNEGTGRGITVGMSRETANQINWDNYDSDNLERHADVYRPNYFLLS